MAIETIPATPPTTTVAQPTASAQVEEVARVAEPSLLAVITLVLWMLALAIGLIGLWLSHPRPVAPPPAKPPEPVQAQIVTAEITPELVQSVAQPLSAQDQIAAPADEAPPPLPAVAAPSPAIAFALPVEGVVRIVTAREAIPIVAPRVQPVQRLIFGQGEARQPAPEYPFQAQIEGQEGSVTIRFTVGEDGRVIAAQIAASSRWPLLNQSALAAVRDRWQFRTGPLRYYEVAIRFKARE